MAEFAPVETIADFRQLDDGEALEGYFDGFHGSPEPGSDRSRSFWHGWRDGRVDAGLTEPDCAQQGARVPPDRRDTPLTRPQLRWFSQRRRLSRRRTTTDCSWMRSRLDPTASGLLSSFRCFPRALIKCASYPTFVVTLISPSVARSEGYSLMQDVSPCRAGISHWDGLWRQKITEP
jgi:hypothetical protein